MNQFIAAWINEVLPQIEKRGAHIQSITIKVMDEVSDEHDVYDITLPVTNLTLPYSEQGVVWA